MATATPPPAPNAPVSPEADPLHDRQIERQLRSTRWQVKLVEFCAALILLAAAGLGYLLLAAIVDHWVIALGGLARWAALIAMMSGVAIYSWKVLFPLIVHSIHPLYAARAIEQSQPTLKNSLINFLMLREHPQIVGAPVLRTLEQRAATDLQTVDGDASVDRSKLIRFGYLLIAVLATAVLYTIVSPKSTFQSIGRVMAPWSQLAAPSRVRIESVEPGDVTVDFGERIEVRAMIHGLRGADRATLLFTTDDRQVVQREVELQLSDNGAYYHATFPDGGAGVQQSLRYLVKAGDAQSQEFNVSVVASPTIFVKSLHYQYPGYTKLPPRTEERKGDIHALEGTTVTIRAEANQDIRAAYLEFDPSDETGDEREERRLKSVEMRHDGRKASVSFALELSDDGRPRYSSYRLRYLNGQGRRNPEPIVHRIEVIEDLPPVVEVLTPKPRKIEVPEDGSQLIELRAVDPDFGLASLGLQASAGEAEIISDVRAHEGLGQVVERFDFIPKRLGLKAGDTVIFRGVAEDNRTDSRGEPKPNTETTPDYQITIVEGKKDSGGGSTAKPDEGGSTETKPGEPDPSAGERPGERKPGERGGETRGEPESTKGGDKPDSEGGAKSDAGGKERGGEEPDGAEKKEGKEEGGTEKGKEEGAEPGEEGGGAGEQAGGKGEEKAEQGPQGAGGKGDPGEESSAQSPQGGAAGQTKSDKPGGEGQQSDSQSGGQTTAKAGGESGGGSSPGSKGGAGGRPDEPAHDGEAIERIRELIEQQQGGGDNAQGQPGQQNKEQSSRDGGQKSGSDAGGSPQGGAGKPKGGESQPDGGGGASDFAEKSRGKTGSEAPPQNPGDNLGQPGGDPKGGDNSKGRQQGGESSSQSGKPQPESAGGSPQDENAGKAGEEKPGGGSGEQPKDDRGAPGGKQGSEKSEKGSQKQSGKSDSPAPTIDKKTSKSSGDEGGDRTGGGKKGGGQGGSQKGNDRAGGESSADEGAGASTESGDGDVSASAGDKKEAAGKTGKSGDQKGEGSSSRRAAQGKAANDQGSPQQATPQQPNDPARDETAAKSARSGNQRQGGSGSPQGGGLAPPNGDAANTQPIRDVRDGDEANLDYARKSTDMVLDYLKHHKDDTKLLDDLGWTPERAAKFINRWETLRKTAREDPRARRVLEDNLRGLGLRPGGSRTRRQQATRDQQAVGEEGGAGGLPSEFLKQFNAYKRGTAKAR